MIIFSTLVYALGKALGPQQATALVSNALERGPDPRGEPLDCLTTYRALERALPGEQIGVLVDAGGSHLPKARSRQFTLALEHDPDVWVSCDDDVAVTPGTAVQLLRHARVEAPRVIVVPCALRGASASPIVGSRGEALAGDPASVNVTWADDRGDVTGLRRIRHGGFGLVAVNRAAMRLIAEQSFRYRELGREWRGAFADVATPTQQPGVWDWYGEDLSFFTRCRGVECWALVEGSSTHAGLSLELGGLK